MGTQDAKIILYTNHRCPCECPPSAVSLARELGGS